MAIFNFMRGLANWLRQYPLEPDDVLDARIRDALLEEINVPGPALTWERLRQVIIEHKSLQSQGMWILDEPFRDPPESSPTLFTRQQFEHIHRIYTKPKYDSPNWMMLESLRFSFSVIVSF